MTNDTVLTERQSFWLKHLRVCGADSMKDYAAAHGLDVRLMYEAKARLKHKGLVASSPSRFVRVERAEGRGASSGYCRVHLRNGTAVDVACAREDWSALLSSVAALP